VKELSKTKRGVAAACVLVLVPALAAQQPAGQGAPPKKFYEELIKTPIVPPRSADEIQGDVRTAEQNAQQIDKATSAVQARIKEADGWIAANKGEMDGLKAKISIAKKEKREADKLTLEGQLKQLDLVDEYLKKTKDIRNSEMDLTKAQKELVNAQKKVYQSELELTKKEGAIKSAGPASPNLTKTVLDATQAGESTLKLMKAMAEKNEDVVGQMKKLAERRIDLAQARNKLLSEDRIRSVATETKK
jgi:hypothetical protein